MISTDAMLRLILNSRVYDVAHETPLDRAHRLSRRLGNEVLLKREDLQPVFSYKLRGAYNRIAHMTEAERARGVIAASAGNHAQGVAFSARHLGLDALIVMPKTTPAIKVEAVSELGAEVVLSGDNYTEAKRHCDELVAVDRPHVRASVRRRAGDCGTGDRRPRDPAAQARRGGRDLRPGRRRRADCGHRQLRQGAAAVGRSDRRRAVRGGRDVPVARRWAAGSCSIASASSPTASRSRKSAASRSRSCSRPCARSCASRTTRSARRSRTSSTTRGR